MPMLLPFSAVVLAAGHSSRMGRDKALLEIEGQPLWRRQRDVLVRAGAAEIFLSARPEQDWTRAAGAAGFSAVLHDALPSAGPLCGIVAAIERAAHGHVAVVAIDLPRITADWFAALGSQGANGVGVVGRRATFFEPLAAIYPREFLSLAWPALAGGRVSLQPLLAEAVTAGLLRAREITDDEAAQFENWNAPRE